MNVKTYAESEFNIEEILRYAGCKGSPDETVSLVKGCIGQVRQSLVYKVCYTRLPDLSFTEADSADLTKQLRHCDEIVLFAATIGLEIDRLVAKYGHTSPSKALIFQAIGAERIENLCDQFCAEIESEANAQGRRTQPRFSPGYGDLPLSMQRDIFRVLDCPRKIGLTLNESLLMSPTKSVTAIIGIKDGAPSHKHKKCSDCPKIDCTFRSE